MKSIHINKNRFLSGKESESGIHFNIKVNQKKFVFVYIRKCACTTLKRLAKNVHPDSSNFFEYARINAFDPNRDRADYIIFFYRDPVERFISCIVNKFIEMRGAVDIIRSVENALEKKMEDITVSEICFDYLPACYEEWGMVDAHFHPIIAHLLPIRYTHALNISDIYVTMSRLMGKSYANKFFKIKLNQSKTRGGTVIPRGQDNTSVSFAQLRELSLLSEDRSFKKSLVNKAIVQRLREVYYQDYDLISMIKSAK